MDAGGAGEAVKPAYVALIAFGTAVLGFLAGGGLGLLGGTVAGAFTGAGAGACATAQTAVDAKLLTETQADELGQRVGKRLLASNPKLQGSDIKVSSDDPFCTKFLDQVRRGATGTP